MSDLQTDINEAITSYEYLKQQMSEKVTQTMVFISKEFFELHPGVKTIYWAQCKFKEQFTMMDINYSPEAWTKIESPDFYSEKCQPNFSSKTPGPLADSMKMFEKYLDTIEDCLETTFGSNVFIRLHKDGIEVVVN